MDDDKPFPERGFAFFKNRVGYIIKVIVAVKAKVALGRWVREKGMGMRAANVAAMAPGANDALSPMD